MKSRIIICLGLSFTLLLGIFALWGGLSFQELTGFRIADILKYWSTPLLLAIGLASFSILTTKKPPTKKLLVFLPLVVGVFIGFGVVLLFDMTPENALYPLLGSAVSTGIGYGFALLLWQHHLSRFSHDEVAKLLLISLVISSAGYLLLHYFMQNQTWLTYSFITMAIVVLLLLAAGLPDFEEARFYPIRGRENLGSSVFRELGGSLVCVSAISVAVALTRMIALDGIEEVTLINSIPNVCIILVASLLYLVLFGFGKGLSSFRNLSVLGLYRVFFPVIATALLALTIIGSSLALAVATLVYVVFSLVLVFIMLTSITPARTNKVWSPCIYGIYAGFTYLFFAAATAFGAWGYYPKNLGIATFPVAILVVLYILTMSYVAIQNRKRFQIKEKRELTVDAESDINPHFGTTVIDEISQRCSVLTKQCRLTAREGEILVLMAKGRDVPSISKKLYISENTVRSHSKGVYRKLDVHTKQELLDLLETVPLVSGGKEKNI